MCRHGVIELLADLGPLPPALMEECRYDAYDAMQELIAEMQITVDAA